MGNIGSTYTYTADGFHVRRDTAISNSLALTLGSRSLLYAKNGTGDENGLGIVNDPSGNYEINGPQFIQMDVSSARAAGVTAFKLRSARSRDAGRGVVDLRRDHIWSWNDVA